MAERRFEHLDEVEAAGLVAPDDQTMHFLWQIVDEGVLGASRHVDLGNQLILHLIGTGEDGLRRSRLAAAFIARTRGQDTPVIGNSLNLLLAGLDECAPEKQADLLRNRVLTWREAAHARKQRLVSAATRHLAGKRGVMAFDYSSTVSAVVISLVKQNPQLKVIVPESRAIAGGARYLEEFLPAGLNIVFIPDAAIEYGLEQCDAALFGVETLRCDGSFLNTIGSRMIARLAQGMGVEIFGVTDLLKLDTRSYSGHRPAPVIRGYDAVLTAGMAIGPSGSIDTRAPELEIIPPALTTALLTEFGPVPPGAIWALGRSAFNLNDETAR